ncbi:hypothetical protein [Variovorax sp. YR216]|nr:hypothetical protein [Variovorax sp. YR216]SEB23131.1 hypothetical protein SAMN05444680_11772 [Variovorax sp. YR216]
MQEAHSLVFEYVGKTLNLRVIIILRARLSRTTMFTLLAQVARFFRSSGPANANLATTLMEAADGRAGLDAHHAQELRAAASAWLSVIR